MIGSTARQSEGVWSMIGSGASHSENSYYRRALVWPSVVQWEKATRGDSRMRGATGLPRSWATPVGWARQKSLLCLTWPLEPCLVCRAEFILLPLSQAISALIIPRGLQLAAFPRNSGRVAEDSVLRNQQGSTAESPWLVIPAAGLLA